MPEKDFWNEVSNRLNNYSENPDDDGWDRIAGALPKSKSTSAGKRWSGIVLIFLLGTSTGYLLHQYAPLNEGARTSFGYALSEDDESVTDKMPASGAASPERMTSNQAIPVESSQAAVDKEVSKHIAEDDPIYAQSTSGSTPSDKEARNRHSDNKLQIQKQRTKTASGLANAEQRDALVSTNGKHVMITQGTSDQYAKSNLSEHSKGTNTPPDGNKNATVKVATASEGNVVERSNSEHTSIPEMEKRGKDNQSERIGQLITERPDAIMTNAEELTFSPGSNGKTLISGDNTLADDSVVVEKEKLVTETASGQSEKKEQKQKKEKRIFHADVYANLTPSLSFQKITPLGNDDLRVVGLQSNGVMSGDRLGVSLEAGFQRRLTPRLDFYVGLSYYRQKQALTYEYNGQDVIIEQGGKQGDYAITPVKESKSFQYNMTNAGISSGIMYHLIGDKLMHKIGGGFQLQKGLMRMGSESSYNNAESFYFNYQLSYRLECQLNSKWNVYLQPTFIHAIFSKEELTEPFTIKPYRAGLGIGAIYHF